MKTKHTNKVVCKRKEKCKEHIPLIHALKEMRPSRRAVMLCHLDAKTNKYLCEVIGSIVSRPRMSTDEAKQLRKHLSRHKDNLREVIKLRMSPEKKKALLKKLSGRPLDVILESALPKLFDWLENK